MSEPGKFVYKSTLRKGYGLTPTMIDELGEPDKYCKNPHWQGAPDASLYSVARVEVWIGANRERVERARASRARRSAAAQAVQERKREERRREAFERANGLVIAVERRLPATLIEDARRNHVRAPAGGVSPRQLIC